MFFSAKELSDLVLESIQNSHPEKRSIAQLIYFLHFPTKEVPITIAEILCSDEDYLNRQDTLGKRLAWGHAEDLSQFRDIELRATRQLRISRQLNRIVLHLASQKAPANIGGEFSNLVERFVHILNYFDARKENSQLAYAAEEVLLLEKVIESFHISNELAEKFLSLLFERLKPSQVKTVALSLTKKLRECEVASEKNTGSCFNETIQEQLIIPSETPLLRADIRCHKNFQTLCKSVYKLLEKYSGPVDQLH